MIYDVNYIRNYMNELDKITGHCTKNIPIKLSKRMTRGYGYCQYEYINGVLKTALFKFSTNLLECGATKDQINDIIRHEYCHSWADEGHKDCSHHKGRFIECCNKLNCGYKHANTDQNLSQKYRSKVLLSQKEKSCSDYRFQFMFDTFYPIDDKITYRVSAMTENGLTIMKVNYKIKKGYSEEDVKEIVHNLNTNKYNAIYTINNSNKGTIVYAKKQNDK